MIDWRTDEQTRRLGRLRRSAALRDVFRETRLNPSDLVLPLFVVEDERRAGEIASMPGVRRHALGELARAADEAVRVGVRSVLLFGIPQEKDEAGSAAYDDDGVVPMAVRVLKARHPSLAVITDACLCQYTSHGGCLAHSGGDADDAGTLEALGRVAVSHAAAGADLIAPSGMLDGGVHAIRTALDDAGFVDTGILAYSAKFASSLYGPFRDAAHSAPTRGDRRSHQLDVANGREAIAEAVQDRLEGADAVMVKPAGTSLDIVTRLRDQMPDTPLAAYQVGGEYAMIVAAAQRGWLDERATLLESLLAIKRAGADAIITYAAVRAAGWLREHEGARS